MPVGSTTLVCSLGRGGLPVAAISERVAPSYRSVSLSADGWVSYRCRSSSPARIRRRTAMQADRSVAISRACSPSALIGNATVADNL